ncbi:hypothetical protein C8F01DRAFT_338112 [Mycena amicta]|nr:hypothetical protein C8F01DRAFT_338112 [Mycena amicta]
MIQVASHYIEKSIMHFTRINYEEICGLQIAKGFDPDSQLEDVVRHLEYPLCELVSDIKARKHGVRGCSPTTEDDWTLSSALMDCWNASASSTHENMHRTNTHTVQIPVYCRLYPKSLWRPMEAPYPPTRFLQRSRFPPTMSMAQGPDDRRQAQCN